jgi:hypothetical protein
MQLQPGQIISAPSLPAIAEIKKSELRSGYALLEVVLHDGHQTYKPLRITLITSNETNRIKEFALWPFEQAAESGFGQKMVRFANAPYDLPGRNGVLIGGL